MKKLAAFIVALFLALSFSRAQADTILLTTGGKIEGKVINESGNDVTIEVMLPGGITDEQSVMKSQIQSIDRKSPEDAEFDAISVYKPGANSLRAEAYEHNIAELRGFISKFPDNAHLAEVKQILAALEAESGRAEAGEVMLNGTWLAREKAEKMKYQSNADALFAEMKTYAARRDVAGALNSFDRLEREVPGARVYPDAVDFARKIMVSLQPQIEQLLVNLKHDDEARLKTIATMTDKQKTEITTALHREQLQFETALANAERMKLKWPPLIPRCEKSLSKYKQLLPTNVSRLAALPVAKMRESLQHIDAATRAIESKDAAAADAELKTAATLWPLNNLVALKQDDLEQMKLEATTKPSSPVPIAMASVKPVKNPASTPAPPPVEEEKSFFLTIKGALTIFGVIVVIAGGVALFGKIKARQTPVE